MTYRVEAWTVFNRKNYGGGWTEEDVKEITRGYKANPVYSSGTTTAYTRKNSRKIFFVKAE